VKRQQVRLKRSVADLRRQLTALSRTNQELLTKVTALVASQETETPKEQSAGLRPTSRSLGALRRRLGLTQVQYGTLLGVSGQAVGQGESKATSKGSQPRAGVSADEPARRDTDARARGEPQLAWATSSS
jgi:DNA-binding transcriptional regulator YiaG